MLAEAIKTIGTMARASECLEAIPNPLNPRELFVRRGDEYFTEMVEPPDRAHRLRGVSDVISLASDKVIAPSPEIYIGPDAIEIMLKREDRFEVVRMPLNKSERWQKVESLRAPWAAEPRDIVKLLRYELHGTGLDNIIAALRNVDFTQASGAASATAHGRDTLGHSVDAAVVQAENIPEEFSVAVEVYSNPGARFVSNVRFGLYLDTIQRHVEICVLADQLEAAIQAAQDSIAVGLRAGLEGTPIVFGEIGQAP